MESLLHEIDGIWALQLGRPTPRQETLRADSLQVKAGAA
jgi:hypothetical protein